MTLDSALLHDRVDCVPGFYLGGNGEMAIRDGTPPNIVISLAASNKRTAVFPEDVPDDFLVLGH